MAKRTSHRASVALLIETSNAYGRGLIQGVMAYARRHADWSLQLVEQRRGERPPDWIEHWRGDGVLARIENPQIARMVRRMRLPTVDMSAGRLLPGVPCVETDDPRIARMAFEHLYERGLREFAFYGDARFAWSAARREAFVACARERGRNAQVLDHPWRSGRGELSWRVQRERVGRWLRELPKPIGILSCFDARGQYLLEICKDIGVEVPGEAAVIGVDNDEMICALATPPLSSVVLDATGAGFKAAELLGRMLRKRRVAPEMHLLAPLRVRARQSTDVLAVSDPVVRAAGALIADQACRGISVKTLLATMPVSRRVLEARFLAATGRTPHAEITRVRIEQAKRLLEDDELTIAQIARETGYRSGEYLSTAFHRVAGLSPSAYRAKLRNERL